MGCAVRISTLYIQDIKLDRVIGTFLEIYISGGISELAGNEWFRGLDKDFHRAGFGPSRNGNARANVG
jgi:hypothetical protein